MKYFTVPVLYVLFSLTSAIAGLVGLLGLLLGQTRYISTISRSMDRLLAALFGFDGTNTLSWECAHSECRFCKLLCKILDKVLEKDHCANERL